MQDTTIDNCDGILTDSDALFGGKYEKNENFIFSICPGSGAQIIFDFIFLNLEVDYDSISFYDGPDTLSPFLGGWTGTQTGLPSIIANSGCLTIRFVSDGSLQLNGWNATWNSISPPIIPPTLTTATTSPPACDSSSFIIEFSSPVHCDSIRASDFVLTGTNAPSVINVQPISCNADSTKFAQLFLNSPFQYNCNYTLEFNLNILDICDSLWQFIITDNFDFTSCKIPYELSPNDTICINNCTNIDVEVVPGCSPVTYYWDNGLPSTPGPHNVCPLVTTTYNLVITETNSGIQIFDSITVYVQDTFNTNLDIVISNSMPPECGSSSFNVLFDPPLPCYLLDSGVFVISNGYSSPSVVNVVPLGCSGDFLDSAQLILDAPFSGNCNYIIDFDLSFTHSCTGKLNLILTDSFDINSCPLSAVSSYPDTICEGSCDSVSVLANGCSTYSYAWSNGLPPTEGPHEICPISDSVFYVTVTEDSTGLLYVDTISIVVLPLGIDLSMGVDPQIIPNCESDSIVVVFSNPVNCLNIADSNFKLIGGVDTLSILSVIPNNCVGGITNGVTIKLTNSFDYNCDYNLSFSIDMVDLCGDTVTVSSSDTIEIRNCPIDHTVTYNPLICITTCTRVTISDIESCYGLTYSWSNGLADTNVHVVCPIGDTTFYVTIIEDSTGLTTIDTISIEVDSTYDRFTMGLDSSNYLPDCDSNKLFVKFSRKVPCDSIYTSAFRLVGIGGAANIIVADVKTEGCINSGDSSQYAILTLASPLDFYSDYRIYFYVNALECRTTIVARNIRIENHETDYSFSDTCFYNNTLFNAEVDSIFDMDSLLWSFDDPLSGLNNKSSAFNTSHYFSAPGTYNVQLLVFYSCEIDTITKQVTITSPLSPVITGNLYLCPGIVTTLDAGPGFASYLWSTGDNTQTITISVPGIYSVIVGDGSGCSTGRDTVEVVLGSNLLVNITGELSYCPGTGTTIMADSGFVSYLWNNNLTSPSVSINLPGVYSVIVKDSLGCSGYDTVEVLLGDNLATSITGLNVICPGIEANLDAGSGYVFYRWSNGDTTQSIRTMLPGEYSVFVQDTLGCSGYDTIDISWYPEANLSIIGDTFYCLGYFTMLTTGDGYSAHEWNNGLRNQEIMVSREGEYSIRVLDANYCWAYDTVNIVASICIDTCIISIPNAFTPNGDGFNDLFKPVIKSCVLDVYEFFIFNRWGQLVFETSDIDKSWDGIFKGELSKIDSYVWIMRYKRTEDLEIRIKKGHVNIIK